MEDTRGGEDLRGEALPGWLLLGKFQSGAPAEGKEGPQRGGMSGYT